MNNVQETRVFAYLEQDTCLNQVVSVSRKLYIGTKNLYGVICHLQ